jgi:hypothetical protein
MKDMTANSTRMLDWWTILALLTTWQTLYFTTPSHGFSKEIPRLSMLKMPQHSLEFGFWTKARE